MNRTLCLDLGNTRLKYAVFEPSMEGESGIIVAEGILANDRIESVSALLKDFHPEKSVLSSVISHNKAIEVTLKQHTLFHKLSHLSRLAFTFNTKIGASIGADRLAFCAAAIDQAPESHNLVISLGTCITYNFIDIFHRFLGGAIAPGMRMRFQSMYEQTAFLPLVEPSKHFPLIGYDTITNIQTGVIMGIAHEIDGFIASYREKYTDLNVFLTGGDIDFFSNYLQSGNIIIDDDFLFKGLYCVSQMNN